MSREVENPRLIDLSELPEEGLRLAYTEESGELNSALYDVIESRPFSIRLEVMPLGNAYSVTGQITTKMGLICSKCAMDFDFPVNVKVDEIFVVEPKRPRSSKSARVNHSTELDILGPDCTELTSPILDIGELAREMILLAEPSRPLGRADCETNMGCPNLIEAQKGGWAPENFAPDPAERSPFAALKDFKLNN